MKRDGPIRVLLVDDRVVLGRAIAAELNRATDLHATSTTGDSDRVREALLRHHPDVLVVDLSLAAVDCLVLLRKLRVNYPVPVIVTVSPDDANADRADKVLELGALELVVRPSHGRPEVLRRYAADLVHRVRKAASLARPVPLPHVSPSKAATFRGSGLDPDRFLVVVGASTGGTEAISALLDQVPADFPPTVIVQHMPAGFTYAFAHRLNEQAAVRVGEAVEGQMIRAGTVAIARGDAHVTVRAAGNDWVTRYAGQEPVNRHCPSVDVLFRSAVPFGRRVVGILLTGMGGDGAQGLLRLRRAGAVTFAQSEASCVVYGMPKMAVDLGAAMYVAAPSDIPRLVLQAVMERQARPRPIST